MKFPLRRSALAAALVLLPLLNFAADPETPAAETPVPAAAAAPSAAQPETLTPEQALQLYAERLAAKGVKTTAGPAKVALGSVAEYNLAPGQLFVGADSLDAYYTLTHNIRGGKEVGVVISISGWTLYFDYDPVGYVKDDEKDKLDASKLLKSLQEGQEEGNAARKERGWDEMKLQGWAAAPHYDEKTHNLKWALNLTSSRDNHKEVWINESIRLLGRGGIMKVTVVCDTDGFAAAMQETDTLLASSFAYLPGKRYAEWKQGDKIAAYGLSALVLGGGVAVAAKMGVLAKFWKVIVLGIGAIGAAIAKFFRKITGSRPADEQ